MNRREIERKGFFLFKSGRVKKDFETEKRIYFTVKGETETHSVIFDKIQKKFFCDCKWFSLKENECSHIYAAKLFLKKLERCKIKPNSPKNKPRK